ncbi:hypothetical protein RRG08_054624 [Elysia crispata]|uniref:Uncharacterized protein n=1 Tax=Elysia crispata TaxID=231223 RepID=A0AAE1E803_9GAST|nr:hypothetical protein RRG08_054624 [Elysia crispata]
MMHWKTLTTKRALDFWTTLDNLNCSGLSQSATYCLRVPLDYPILRQKVIGSVKAWGNQSSCNPATSSRSRSNELSTRNKTEYRENQRGIRQANAPFNEPYQRSRFP